MSPGPVVAVTGATGWLGRAAVARLHASGRPFAAFAATGRTVHVAGVGPVDVAPLEALPDTPHGVLLHLAFVTREHAAVQGLDAYVAANAGITATVREAIARQRPHLAYASSGAAAGAAGRTLEEDPYGVLKLRDEAALAAAAAAAGRGCAIARVFAVAGPHVTKPGGFAVSDLLGQAQRGAVLHVRAPHPVERSYADVDDVVALLLALAGAGRTVAFDAAGAEVVEVGALAARIAATLGRPGATVERPHVPRDAAPDRYVGDPTTFAALCAEHGIRPRGLDEQLARTAAALRPDLRALPVLTGCGDGPARAARAFAANDLARTLVAYDPVVVSSLASGLGLRDSDLDVACDLRAPGFAATVERAYGDRPGFARRTQGPLDLTTFAGADGTVVELVGEPRPVAEQVAHRHAVAHRRLVDARGPAFAAEVRALRRATGLKTEPAIARVLGLPGDPYAAVLALGDA